MTLGTDAGAVRSALGAAPDVVAIPDATNPEAYATSSSWDDLVERLLAALATAHREQPMERGSDLEHLRSQLAPGVAAKTFRWCVDRLAASTRVVREESLVRLPTHRVGLDPAGRTIGAEIVRRLEDARFTPPDVGQLAGLVGADRRRVSEVLAVFEREGAVARIAPELFYGREAAEAAKALLADHCRAHGEISAAAFRDLIGASRKFAIAFLDWCDRTGITTRVGDMRRLRR
jgi:selenocysteine-specific elongation factor